MNRFPIAATQRRGYSAGWKPGLPGVVETEKNKMRQGSDSLCRIFVIEK